jgi:hypothetical protein
MSNYCSLQCLSVYYALEISPRKNRRLTGNKRSLNIGKLKTNHREINVLLFKLKCISFGVRTTLRVAHLYSLA